MLALQAMRWDKEIIIMVLIVISGMSIFGIGVIKKFKKQLRPSYDVRAVMASEVCAEPLKRFCNDTVLNQHTRHCLYVHIKDVSLNCVAQMDVCGPEIVANCEKMDSLKEYRACVLNRATELSQECQEAEYPCFEDTRTYCYGIPRGIELLQCLFKNKDLLKPYCLERIMEKAPPWVKPKQ
ncbi:MAG: hypothetical protein K2X47_12145 [Bdellovibrionales bacterium]|nr:hypothetical protein [Bdellovibrionales bacterium]